MELDTRSLFDGLIAYFCFLIVLTFHEAGHAWMAWRRGDDTAKMLGRISLNPLDHMDMVGTVILPLLGVVLGAAGSVAARFVIGWGKPVPVSYARLEKPLFDGMLIAVAGPFMNVVVALVAMGLFRVGMLTHSNMLMEFTLTVAMVSMFLCFFNLLPIPPLDGSHVARFIFGWGEEQYAAISRFGLIGVILVLQVPAVTKFLSFLTFGSLQLMGRLVGAPIH